MNLLWTIENSSFVDIKCKPIQILNLNDLDLTPFTHLLLENAQVEQLKKKTTFWTPSHSFLNGPSARHVSPSCRIMIKPMKTQLRVNSISMHEQKSLRSVKSV